uniref:L-type lectin-like domain-containing protein n=1 Tax=Plectus sambesii TaxID=2011161 RepID=A0A914WKD5_9BILA
MTSAMLSMLLCCFVALDRVASSPPSEADSQAVGLNLEGVSVNEWRGYYKREHSLVKPYQGSGMDIPYWDIVGSTMVSSSSIKLTQDQQSRQGAIWNRMPLHSRDWEMQVSFKVHGTTGELFGDGMAIWYIQERSQLGPVFGSKDYFRGLGIFLDTYSNHNGPHGHGHPYISAMVSNGSAHYDHDRDGTHTQLGGEHTGCESKFRNKDYETQILIRYVGDVISMTVEEVDFPRGGAAFEVSSTAKAGGKRKSDKPKKGKKVGQELTLENSEYSGVWTQKLRAEYIQPGLVALACVRQVREDELLLELSDGNFATLPANGISKKLAKSSKQGAVSLADIYRKGQMLVVKVTTAEVNKGKRLAKKLARVTTDPSQVNSHLMPSTLSVGTVLIASIQSIEDK